MSLSATESLPMNGGQASTGAISLREWRRRALDGVEISSVATNKSSSLAGSYGPDASSWPAEVRRSLALSSDAYLVSALRVSISLADQICRAEDPEEQLQTSNSLQHSLVPRSGPDWADRVVVRLPSSGSVWQDINLEPLPLSTGDSPDPRELKDMLNSLIPDTSLFEAKEDDRVAEEAERQAYADLCKEIGIATSDDCPQEKVVPLREVTKAEILLSSSEIMPSSISGGSGQTVMDRRQRIHSLGLVFYELFGGENPKSSSDSRVVNQQSADGSELEAYDQMISKNIKKAQTLGSIDLAGGLNIVDEEFDCHDLPGNDSLGSELRGDSSDIFGEQQGLSKKRASRNSTCSDNSVSIEPLRMMGLPSPLCDLIANMLDSVNGDLSSDEAYLSMADVRSDLQLMLDRPNRFLHDLDLARLSATGLQLGTDFFDRKREFCTLKDAYRRSVSGESELAIISGPSGIGKSVLANRLGGFAVDTGGIFISGKFDQQRQAKPFHALTEAFNDYCTMILRREGGADIAKDVALRLNGALGDDICHLEKVIPNLRNVLGDYDREYENEGAHDCVDAQKRLHYLLCRFVNVISSSSEGAITLYLDDVQWADPASIAVINQLLLISGSLNSSNSLFFLFCSREEGLIQEHPFGKMVTSVRYFGVQSTILELNSMDKDTTNKVVSDLLCLSPRLTRSLSEIVHNRSKGNPLFFSRLMMSLAKDGLLHLCLNRRRWIWDEEKIQTMSLPDDVATFLSKAISKLPPLTIDALRTLSCLGARTDCAVIKEIELRLGEALREPLEAAIAEGIVDKSTGGAYFFCHDRLQESSYNMIQAADRNPFHFRIGTAIVPLALERGDDSMLFMAAGQVNRGGPESCCKDDEKRLLIANLNLSAGNKAMAIADFTSAYSFFDNGISFLPRNHWKNNYALSLELFQSAAKCAKVIGEVASLNILSEQIFHFATSFEDTLEALYITVESYIEANQLSKAIDKSTMILEKLGEPLPELCTSSNASIKEDIMTYLGQTKMLLRAFTDTELEEHKLMDDKSKLMASKFYARLEAVYHMIQPTAQPIVSLKLVQLSLAHGMSPQSPIGFVFYGILLAGLGSVREGYRYVKIARALTKRMGSKEAEGEVVAVGVQLQAFIEPVQSVLDCHIQGHDTAMANGDIRGALLNGLFFGHTTFTAGTKLPLCQKQYAGYIRLMEQHNQYAWFIIAQQCNRPISILIGNEESAKTITLDREKELRERNPSAQVLFSFNELYIAFMFRKDHDEVKELAEQYYSSDEKMRSWNVLFNRACLREFIFGLASFRLYRKSGDQIWIERGRKAKLGMKKYTDECSSWNFGSKFYLLEAEEYFSDGNFESAQTSYEMAISSARNHRFVNDEALSYELAGLFFSEIGKTDVAMQYFLQSHEKYHEWGAVAKANALFQSTIKSLSIPIASPTL